MRLKLKFLGKVNLESMQPAVSPFGVLQGGLGYFARCHVTCIMFSSRVLCGSMYYADQ